MTTWHTWARRAPRVARVHDDYQIGEPGPPYPSVVFHTYASADTSWAARTLSHYTSGSRVGCHPTQWPSKLLSLWDSINPVCTSTYSNLVHSDPPDVGLNQHKRGLPLWSSKLITYHSSSFPSSILHFPLIAPPDLQLCQHSQSSC
jgi:hypothetical protein